MYEWAARHDEDLHGGLALETPLRLELSQLPRRLTSASSRGEEAPPGNALKDGTMPLDDPNVGLAFGLTVAAGAATAVGAAVVFVPSLVKLASRRTLAGALALSAGVMTYVSFVEILGKSRTKFLEAGHPDNMAYTYATVCFFGGVILMTLLNWVVTALLGSRHHHHHDAHPPHHHHSTQSSVPTEHELNEPTRDGEGNAVEPNTVAACPCCSDDPVGDLENVQRMAQEMEHLHAPEQQNEQLSSPRMHGEDDGSDVEQGETKREVEGVQAARENEENRLVTSQEADEEASRRKQVENQKLMRMSINTALAIGLHNFPEGLATFLSTLADPSVGVVLAVAIAIHNIPEGICVAMPVYYATGSRWKAFGWAVLSGLSEPFAALLGWAVLASVFSDNLYATLFGIVAGMMVIISTRELMPTAHRYDPEDTVVTYSFMVGMAIMALSLVLFML